MIKFIVARKNNVIYNEYLKTSLEKMNVSSYDVFDSKGENLSLTKKYNLGIEKSIKDGLDDNDIIIFAHEDIKVIDQYFEDKVNLVFQNEKIGMLGVIGCSQLTRNCMWWGNRPEWLFGHCLQEYRNGKTSHLIKGSMGYCEDIVAIDGLIIMIKGKVLKDGLRFDENFKFNFYDICICLDLLKNTKYKIAVADILILHKSEGLGSLTKEWHLAKNKMIQKYKKMGVKFPIMISNFKQDEKDKLYDEEC